MTFAQQPRNAFRGPGYKNIDLSLFKNLISRLQRPALDRADSPRDVQRLQLGESEQPGEQYEQRELRPGDGRARDARRAARSEVDVLSKLRAASFQLPLNHWGLGSRYHCNESHHATRERTVAAARCSSLCLAAHSPARVKRQGTKPDYPFKPVPFTRVHLNDVFWAPRIETNRTASIPVGVPAVRADGPRGSSSSAPRRRFAAKSSPTSGRRAIRSTTRTSTR